MPPLLQVGNCRESTCTDVCFNEITLRSYVLKILTSLVMTPTS